MTEAKQRTAVPAPSTETVYEVCQHCGGDIRLTDSQFPRWHAVESRYPNAAHCHYSAKDGKTSVGHSPLGGVS